MTAGDARQQEKAPTRTSLIHFIAGQALEQGSSHSFMIPYSGESISVPLANLRILGTAQPSLYFCTVII